MADVPNPWTDPVILGVIGLAIGLGVLTIVEVRHIRKAIREDRVRKTRRNEDLHDDAYNAIVTAKAVSAALRRAGVTTAEADSLIAEADTALTHRNYRVVIDLTDRARGILKAEKSRYDRMGDLAKLERVTPTRADVPTTKEQLIRDLPPNFTASKFAIQLAEAALVSGRAAGRDVGAAERIARTSRERFDAEDYGAALALAVHARKVAEGGPVPEAMQEATVAPPAEAANAPRCRQCGSAVAADDVFCRKCGAKIAT